MVRKRVPIKVVNEMWGDLERNLNSQMAGRTHGAEMRNAFVNVLGALFMMPRYLGKRQWLNFKPIWVGPYRVDPTSPDQTVSDACFRVPAEIYNNPDIVITPNQSETLARLAELAESDPDSFHQQYANLTENFRRCGGCSPIPFERGGVIKGSATDGQNRYIPDVTQLSKGCHVACDTSTREGGVPTAEYTIIFWGEPFTRHNPSYHEKIAGLRAPVAIWDIDLQQTEMPLIRRDMTGLIRILREWNPILFRDYTIGGEAAYTPTPQIALKNSHGGIVHVDVNSD
jgi:hypothetical protein